MGNSTTAEAGVPVWDFCRSFRNPGGQSLPVLGIVMTDAPGNRLAWGQAGSGLTSYPSRINRQVIIVSQPLSGPYQTPLRRYPDPTGQSASCQADPDRDGMRLRSGRRQAKCGRFPL